MLTSGAVLALAEAAADALGTPVAAAAAVERVNLQDTAEESVTSTAFKTVNLGF